MSKVNQFLTIGSIFIILLVVICVTVVWQRINTEVSKSTPLQSTMTALASTCRGNWQQVPVNVTQSGSLSFRGVAVLSQQDVWAVGDNLVEHWNGTKWQPMSTPQMQNSSWTNITAHSSNDIWIIGQNAQTARAMHWNGTTWASTAIPAPTSGTDTLSGIAVIAPNNAWIAGSHSSGPSSHATSRPLLLHWDGKHWNEVAGAGTPGGSTAQLSGISATSTTNIWAVGSMVDTAHLSQEFVEHWNGKTWQLVPPPPDHAAYQNVGLSSVVAVSPVNVWAVGTGMSSSDPTISGSSSLIEHWDGQKWSYYSHLSEPESRSNTLVSIKMITPLNIWAVGSFVNPNTRLRSAYLQHWNGVQWQIVIWPASYGQPQKNASVGLNDISGSPDGQLIAVGGSTVFTQNPPIDDAAHSPAQPLVLSSCY